MLPDMNPLSFLSMMSRAGCPWRGLKLVTLHCVSVTVNKQRQRVGQHLSLGLICTHTILWPSSCASLQFPEQVRTSVCIMPDSETTSWVMTVTTLQLWSDSLSCERWLTGCFSPRSDLGRNHLSGFLTTTTSFYADSHISHFQWVQHYILSLLLYLQLTHIHPTFLFISCSDFFAKYPSHHTHTH